VDAGERAGVRLQIDPETGADERAALEQALAAIRAATAAPGRSAWWRAGVRESVEDTAGELPL
jgi:hypothetical protein